MTVQFQPDVCLQNDAAGFGLWLLGHAYEHENFRKKCLTLTPPIVVPDYNMRYWNDEKSIVQRWLETHALIHDTLRQATNVNGVDLSLVDLSDKEQWYVWLETHAQEHALMRRVFGMS